MRISDVSGNIVTANIQANRVNILSLRNNFKRREGIKLNMAVSSRTYNLSMGYKLPNLSNEKKEIAHDEERGFLKRVLYEGGTYQ